LRMRIVFTPNKVAIISTTRYIMYIQIIGLYIFLNRGLNIRNYTPHDLEGNQVVCRFIIIAFPTLALLV
ncbi:MAG TPA: hypothetical protein VNU45_02270, partial [Rummeliibacillus sp.]|nr:hypothetical protein [Rummeliibacillus sp.]